MLESFKLPSVSEEFTTQRGKDSLTTQQPAPTQLLVHSLPSPQNTTGRTYKSRKFPEDQLIQPGEPRYWHKDAQITEEDKAPMQAKIQQP